MNSLPKVAKPSPPRTPPLSSLFYVEIGLIVVTIFVASVGVLLPKVPLFLWLPSLLLLAAACVSLSSLIYLNKGVSLHSKSNLTLYVLLTIFIIIFRFFCSALLIIGIFLPHAVVYISLPLLLISMSHSFFGFVAIGRASVYRGNLDKRVNRKDRKLTGIEEIAVANLSQNRLVASSTNTLFTNIDEMEEVLVRVE